MNILLITIPLLLSLVSCQKIQTLETNTNLKEEKVTFEESGIEKDEKIKGSLSLEYNCFSWAQWDAKKNRINWSQVEGEQCQKTENGKAQPFAITHTHESAKFKGGSQADLGELPERKYIHFSFVPKSKVHSKYSKFVLQNMINTINLTDDFFNLGPLMSRPIHIRSGFMSFGFNDPWISGLTRLNQNLMVHISVKLINVDDAGKRIPLDPRYPEIDPTLSGARIVVGAGSDWLATSPNLSPEEKSIKVTHFMEINLFSNSKFPRCNPRNPCRNKTSESVHFEIDQLPLKPQKKLSIGEVMDYQIPISELFRHYDWPGGPPQEGWENTSFGLFFGWEVNGAIKLQFDVEEYYTTH